MGCDIHLYKEKKVDGQWVSADTGWGDHYGDGYEDVSWENQFTDRDYDLFGFLCYGVRSEHDYSFRERGLPFNVSDQVKAVCDRWGVDGHTHSYLSLSDLKDAWEFLKTQYVTVSGMKDKDELEKLRQSIDSDEETDWSLLYPYCHWASMPTYHEFSVKVPASVKLDGVKRIIDLFEGIDGEDHRIVFWFDN